jgi:hypothetical protein
MGWSGRRESNPHDQLGRLVTHALVGNPMGAVARGYNCSALPRCLVWVEIWVENHCCLESVEASAVWSGSVHPNTRTLSGSPHRCSIRCRYSKYTERDNDRRPGMGHQPLPPEETRFLARYLGTPWVIRTTTSDLCLREDRPCDSGHDDLRRHHRDPEGDHRAGPRAVAVSWSFVISVPSMANMMLEELLEIEASRGSAQGSAVF